MSDHPFTPLFEPRNIAVVRSGDAGALAMRVLDQIRLGGFAGEVFSVDAGGAGGHHSAAFSCTRCRG